MIFRGITLDIFVQWTHKKGYEFDTAIIMHKGVDITELLEEELICEMVRFFGEESS